MIYCDALSMAQEMLDLVTNSRSLLEDICTERVEKELTLFALYRCHVGEIISRLPYFNAHRGMYPFKHQECHPVRNLRTNCSSGKDDITSERIMDQGDGSEIVSKQEEEELGLSGDNVIYENLALINELKWEEVYQKVCFFILLCCRNQPPLQWTSNETKKLIFSLSQVRHELEMKTSQLDEFLVEYRKLEGHLVDIEQALFIADTDI